MIIIIIICAYAEGRQFICSGIIINEQWKKMEKMKKKREQKKI